MPRRFIPRYFKLPCDSLRMSPTAVVLLMTVLTATSQANAAGTDAKGTISFKARTGKVEYAYLVKGPDRVTSKPVRRLILSATDLGAKIQSCKTMACVDSGLGEGITVSVGEGPRINYWLTLNNQRIQHSGTEDKAVLKTRVNDPKRLAGTLRFDQSAAGGPKVNVEFDAALAKELAGP